MGLNTAGADGDRGPEPSLIRSSLGVIAAIWGVLLCTYLASRAGHWTDAERLPKLTYAVAAMLLGMTFSCGFIWLLRRIPATVASRRRTWLLLACAFVVTALHSAFDVPLQLYVDHDMSPDLIGAFFANLTFYFWVHLAVGGMLMLIGLSHELRERERRIARMDVDRARAEASTLRFQVQPHFLFNAMNGIHSLMLAGRIDEADGLLTRLASLIRLSLQRDMSAWSPLADELALTECYTAIEEARFGPRLKVRYDVPDDLLDEPVPALVLLPLVESLVAHAAASVGKAEILVRARGRAAHLLLTVAVDRPGVSAPDLVTETEARIRALEGRATLKVRAGPRGHRAVLLVRREPSLQAPTAGRLRA